jgi:hypothetical protein
LSKNKITIVIALLSETQASPHSLLRLSSELHLFERRFTVKLPSSREVGGSPTARTRHSRKARQHFSRVTACHLTVHTLEPRPAHAQRFLPSSQSLLATPPLLFSHTHTSLTFEIPPTNLTHSLKLSFPPPLHLLQAKIR